MKRKLSLAAFALIAATAFAYNPPAGGEDMYSFTDPVLLSGGASATGGALFSVVPGSVAYNPALTAVAQRTVLDVAYTGLINGVKSSDSDNVYAQGFSLGAIVPTKYAVYAGDFIGTFSGIERMDMGNELTLRLNASKMVYENFALGINYYAGFYVGGGSDFTMGADLGGLYFWERLGFLRNPRLGVALLNLGKPYNATYTAATGVKEGKTGSTNYPGIVTPRVSFAATLFDYQHFSGGFSADLAIPTFQNLIFSCGIGFAYADIVHLSTNWEINVVEIANGSKINWPSVGLGIRLKINSEKIGKMSEEWENSEIDPAIAWKNLYGGIHAASAGARINLGMKDTSAPEIILWDEE